MISPPFHDEKKIGIKAYPFAHAAEFAGFELIPGGLLETEHEKFPLEVDDLLVELLRRLRSNLLHLLLPLRHPHHHPSAAAARRQRRQTLDVVPNPDSTEGGFQRRKQRQNSKRRRRRRRRGEGSEPKWRGGGGW